MPAEDVGSRISKLEAKVERQEMTVHAAMAVAVLAAIAGGLGAFVGPSDGSLAVVVAGLAVLLFWQLSSSGASRLVNRAETQTIRDQNYL